MTAAGKLIFPILNAAVASAAWFENMRLIFIAALFGLVMTYFFLLLLREKQEKIDPAVAAQGKSNKWLGKKAAQLESDGEYKGAGDLMMMAGQYEEAAKMYIQGKALGKTGEAFLKLGDFARAAKAYDKRGFPLKAAEYYRDAGIYDEAARTFIKGGKPVKAAEALEQGGRFIDAAEVYKRIGHMRKAGEMYYKAGDKLAAAQTLELAFRHCSERLPESVKPSESRMLGHLAQLIGSFYEQEEKLDEAAAAFESGGHMAEAARLHEQAERYPLAAQLYISAGRNFEAAMAEEKAGRKEEAALIRAEAYRRRGQYIEAIGNYELANKPLEAAHMYMELGDHAKSARMFERAGKFAEAAERYLIAGEKDLAADAYEKAGNHLKAAETYGEVGNPTKHANMLENAEKYIEAGKIYMRAGATEYAIRSLQRVGEGHPDFEQAQILLGDIFREKGIPKIAIQYYRRVLGDKPIERSNMGAYYHLAACMESIGMIRESLQIYEAIVVIDYHFEDVADRIKSIEDRLPATTPGTPFTRTPSEPAMPSIYDPTQTGGDPDVTQVGDGPASKPRRYTIIEEVGRGGMGIVYKARDTVLDRIVAYKILPANLREHPQAVKNFFREAKSAAALNHPNIVTVHDAGEEDGNFYIAMEYLRGKTVKQMLQKDGPMPLKALILVTAQILKALSYAHSRKIVHRDIKSSNIMWTDDKVVKLMDFGLAKVVEEYKASQTVASGTPYYMSPEQTLGANIDHRTDIYSLGVTLFEMALGKLPFADGQAAYHHVHTDPPKPAEVNRAVPEKLSLIILKMMEKEPDKRYQTAEEATEALKSLASEVKGSVIDQTEV